MGLGASDLVFTEDTPAFREVGSKLRVISVEKVGTGQKAEMGQDRCSVTAPWQPQPRVGTGSGTTPSLSSRFLSKPAWEGQLGTFAETRREMAVSCGDPTSGSGLWFQNLVWLWRPGLSHAVGGEDLRRQILLETHTDSQMCFEGGRKNTEDAGDTWLGKTTLCVLQPSSRLTVGTGP